MNDDFNFDDFNDFDDIDNGVDTEQEDSSFEYSNDSPSDDVGNTDVKKSAIKAIAIGASVIVISLVVMTVVRNSKSNKVVSEENLDSTVEVQEKVEVQNKDVGSKSEWIPFTSSDGIDFEEEYIDSTFTVTGIKNYVRIVDNESNVNVKTTLSGSLSGFKGIYTIDIDYLKGNQLKLGNSFKVGVKIGKYDDKVVIGDIKYN